MTKDSFEKEQLKKAKEEALASGQAAANLVTFDHLELFRYPPPSCFGSKWSEEISGISNWLSQTHRDELPELFLYAMRGFEFAKHHGSSFMGFWVNSESGTNHLKALCTPDGYAKYEGCASILYSHLGSNEVEHSLHILGYTKQRPEVRDAMHAIAVAWFYQAADTQKKDPLKALDMLYEISQAIGYAEFETGWNGGCEYEQDIARDKSSENARSAAAAKHKPHTLARKKIVDIWRSGQYKTKNECVTAELDDLKEYCGKSIAWKTAREWLVNI